MLRCYVDDQNTLTSWSRQKVFKFRIFFFLICSRGIIRKNGNLFTCSIILNRNWKGSTIISLKKKKTVSTELILIFHNIAFSLSYQRKLSTYKIRKKKKSLINIIWCNLKTIPGIAFNFVKETIKKIYISNYSLKWNIKIKK